MGLYIKGERGKCSLTKTERQKKEITQAERLGYAEEGRRAFGHPGKESRKEGSRSFWGHCEGRGKKATDRKVISKRKGTCVLGWGKSGDSQYVLRKDLSKGKTFALKSQSTRKRSGRGLGENQKWCMARVSVSRTCFAPENTASEREEGGESSLKGGGTRSERV